MSALHRGTQLARSSVLALLVLAACAPDPEQLRPGNTGGTVVGAGGTVAAGGNGGVGFGGSPGLGGSPSAGGNGGMGFGGSPGFGGGPSAGGNVGTGGTGGMAGGSFTEADLCNITGMAFCKRRGECGFPPPYDLCLSQYNNGCCGKDNTCGEAFSPLEAGAVRDYANRCAAAFKVQACPDVMMSVVPPACM
jgi:hypothetical protein